MKGPLADPVGSSADGLHTTSSSQSARCGWFLAATALFALSCSSGFASTGGAGGAGPTSSASGSSEGVGSGTSSATSSTGTGGGACTPGDPLACSKGMYCDQDSLACAACASAPALRFGVPSPLAIQPPAGGTGSSFPRSAPGGIVFTYQTGSSQPVFQLGYAKANSGAAGFEPGAALPVNEPLVSAFAGLVVEDVSGFTGLPSGVSAPVIFFTSTVNGAQNWAASLQGTTASVLSSLYDPGFADTEIAFSPASHRAWWMISDQADAPSRLVTRKTDGSSTKLDLVSLVFDNGCAVSGDLSPWVAPDGSLLMVQAAAVDSECHATGRVALFSVPLDSDGLALDGNGVPVPLAPVYPDDLGYDASTPSLSPDACTLLFAYGATPGVGEAYAAVRE